MKLTSHLYGVPGLMCGSVYPLPHMFLWCSEGHILFHIILLGLWHHVTERMIERLALLLCIQYVLHQVLAWRPSVLIYSFHGHKLKSPVTAEIRLWHLHPFMNSHFHFLAVVELATSQMSRQRVQTPFQPQPFTKEMECKDAHTCPCSSGTHFLPWWHF
jgi:hypothetical protein